MAHPPPTPEHHHSSVAGMTFDYNEVSDLIYLGTNACCQAHFAEELTAKGITGNISLEKERIDHPEGVEYFLWLPVEDNYAPTMKQLELGVRAMDYMVKNKIMFYVHCKHGHGRAPTLVIAYYMYAEKMSYKGASAFVKSKRPSIHLRDPQIARLKEYEQKLGF